MYKDESKLKINWIDIITKVLFLVAFVLILVWFFPSAKNNTTSQDNASSSDKSSENSKWNFDVLFDRIFNENLTEMKNAARIILLKKNFQLKLVVQLL